MDAGGDFNGIFAFGGGGGAALFGAAGFPPVPPDPDDADAGGFGALAFFPPFRAIVWSPLIGARVILLKIPAFDGAPGIADDSATGA